MRIQTERGQLLPSLPSGLEKDICPTFSTGHLPLVRHHDTIELSAATARELPEGAIVHETPRFFFNVEINETLDEILSGKAANVSKAAYQILESNFFATNRDIQDEERVALREAGLAKAKYLAEHYMADDEASKFMDTMKLLAAVSTTRKVDPATGSVSYVELQTRPKGAPDDYVNASQLMKRFDPSAYADMQEAIRNGENSGSILIQFAKKLRHHPEWVNQYRQEQKDILAEWKTLDIPNRFADVDTGSMSTFLETMALHIEGLSLASQKELQGNLNSFALLLSPSDL